MPAGKMDYSESKFEEIVERFLDMDTDNICDDSVEENKNDDFSRKMFESFDKALFSGLFSFFFAFMYDF